MNEEDSSLPKKYLDSLKNGLDACHLPIMHQVAGEYMSSQSKIVPATRVAGWRFFHARTDISKIKWRKKVKIEIAETQL